MQASDLGRPSQRAAAATYIARLPQAPRIPPLCSASAVILSSHTTVDLKGNSWHEQVMAGNCGVQLVCRVVGWVEGRWVGH